MGKKIKKLLSVLLAAAMLITAAPLAVSALSESDTLNYLTYEISDGEVTITRCDKSFSGEMTIPSTIEDYPVTRISEWAFYNCIGLTNINFPGSLTKIDAHAFQNCSGLTSIKIPGSVRVISFAAFLDCTNLNSLTISDGVEIIGESAFTLCTSLKSVVIPDSVVSISNYAFSDCTELTDVTIGSGVTYISYGIFDGCNALTSIRVKENNKAYDSRDNCNAIISTETNELFAGCKNTVIPNNVISIFTLAFGGCTGLTNITIPDSITSIGYSAFSDCTGLTSITIPDSVTSIGDDAFYGCTGLTSITIPDSVTSIGDRVFSGCKSLTSVKIGKSVTEIGEFVFNNCIGLKSINVDENNNVYDSRENCNSIIETETNTLIQGCKNTHIPDSVTSIGDSAFYNCTNLTNITIPLSLRNIGSDAFYGCTGLTNINVDSNNTVYDSRDNSNAIIKTETNTLILGCKNTTIPDSVTSIGYEAFGGCTGLISITIPDSVTSIGDYAFYNCTGLTSISIPNSVTSIGGDAFYGCTKLKRVTIPKSVTNIGEWAFGYFTKDSIIEKIPDFKIYCYSGTAGERYALENGFDYEILSDTHTHTPVLVTVPATCTVDGMKYYICDECGETIGTPEVIKANGHSFGDWVVTLEPTTEKEGLKTRTCTLCGAEETQKIEKLKKLADDKTGVEIVYNDQFENDVKVEVTQVFDGQSIQLINTEFGEVNTAIYDITTTQDGVKVQPSGSVTVRVPVPADFKGGNIFACYVDSVNGKVTKIPATVVGGYVEFTVEHFSEYALVYAKGTVKAVSVDDIEMNYKKSATLNTVIGVDEGVNYTVEYSSSDPSVAKVDENGNVYGAKKGSAEITVTVTDEFGNVASDTCNVEVKYSFGQWLIVILLFGWIWY